MSPLIVGLVIGANLALIFLLIAAPVGFRTVTASVVVATPRQRLWEALWPDGSNAGWSGEILQAESVDSDAGLWRLRLSWPGRDGRPIERLARFEEVTAGHGFRMVVVEDSALEASFWKNYSETVLLEDICLPKVSGRPGSGGDAGTRVTIARADRYSGLVFLALRWFSLRREMVKLKRWAETGAYRPGGVFEHPLTQFGFAGLSVLILWPFFGLSIGGLAVAFILTLVVALHELGHMAAFRLLGHASARMIFIPLLGGIAIGGRPYDTRFEVAFVALMGAGFSAFLVPVAIAANGLAEAAGHMVAASLFATLAGCAALFNLANLVPVWKFDGGQVLRQVAPDAFWQGAASFVLLAAVLYVGWVAGFSERAVLVGGVVFAVLSLITVGTGVRPRHELKPISAPERAIIAGGLVAILVIHAVGLLWAASKLV